MKVLSQSEHVMTRVATELSTIEKIRFGELLGLIKGDGSLSNGTIAFYNTDMYCARKYLNNFYKIFRVKRNEFGYFLEIRNKNRFRKATAVWKRYLKINKKIGFQKNEKSRKPFGMIRIMIHRKKFYEFLSEKINEIAIGKETNDNLLFGFLRGFFAAEGCVIPGKMHKEVPGAVQFPQKGKTILLVIERALRKLGIDSRIVIKQKKADYYCVNITAHENFKRFYELGLADLHPERKKKIWIGLNSYKRYISRRLTTANKILKIISKRPIDRKSIYKKSKINMTEETPQQAARYTSFGHDFQKLVAASSGVSNPVFEMNRQHVNELLYAKRKSFLIRQGYIRKVVNSGKIKWRITKGGKAHLTRVATEPH